MTETSSFGVTVGFDSDTHQFKLRNVVIRIAFVIEVISILFSSQRMWFEGNKLKII